jgi:cobyrinic acid a,c-diamide synthase
MYDLSISFKARPDYIDSGLHAAITGRPSRNLDLWMCGTDYVKESYSRHSNDAGISVIEGVMVLYDGDTGTLALAKSLGLPVVLVADASVMAQNPAALVKGFADFDKDVDIAGLILNKVSSQRHAERIKAALDKMVFGALLRSRSISIPERHFGLLTSEEAKLGKGFIESLAELFMENVDCAGLAEIKSKKAICAKHRPAAAGKKKICIT